MNIDINELTIGQARKIAELFPVAPTPKDDIVAAWLGQKVIIRTFSAGNFYGILTAKSEDEVILGAARRLWYWQAAKGISLSECAIYGVGPKSRISAPVERIWLKAIEIIPCADEAIKSIEEAPHAEAR